MEIKSTEFFKNMKSLPPVGTKAFDDLIAWEEDKIMGGVNIGGVHIPGWLYWHTNHWWIRIDAVDEYGNDVRKETYPELRDNEWIRAEALEQCKTERKGYMEIGARQGGKSEAEASYLAMNAIMFKNTQNVIVCGNDNDLALIKDKVDFGLRKLWQGLSIPRLDKTWRGNQVRLGFKKSDGDDEIWSYIVIRNAKDGHNTEVAAGTTAKSFIMDEVGKYAFSSAYKAAEPAFKGKHGMRAVPFLVGCLTAGNKVYNKEGNLINIEDLEQKDGIIGFDKITQKASVEDIIHINPPQNKECYKIVTNKGSEIECSYDHPILVKHRKKLETFKTNKRRRKLEFIETKDLSIGNHIAILNELPLYGNKTMEHPYFIGAIIGDGNYSSDRGIKFYNEDQEVWDYIDEIGKDYTIFKQYKTKKGRLYREARFRGEMKQLKDIGIYGQSKDKKDLPKDIHLYREQDVCELIAGLYDTDGCVINHNKNNYISITSISKTMLMSLKLLLVRLGIHSNLSEKQPDKRDRKIKSKSVTFTLDISDKKSILKFADKIKLKIERKQKALNNLKEVFKNRNSRTDSHYKGMRFETIKSITYIGEKPVYNLTTSDTHTYLASNIITHNTGGSFDNGKDAENFFWNPKANNFLEHEYEGKKCGLFLSGLYRQDCKYETNLYDYLVNVEGKEIKHDKELEKIKIWVSDKEKSLETIKNERQAAQLNPDRKIALKQIMYYPLTPDECFLSGGANIFDADAARRQKLKLQAQDVPLGTPVILYEENGKVKHEFTDKQPINTFPLKQNDDKDAPVVIYEFPIENPPYGLYVAGVDPYRTGKAAYSDSLGSVYIFKRMHSISSDSFQEMIVASYTARPDKKSDWLEQARMLVKYYNARTLCENDEMSFIDYMVSKNHEQYLERQPQWLKEIVPNTTVRRDFGIHRSAEKIRNFLHGCLKKYTEEPLYEEKDEEGNIVKSVKGMSLIHDQALLEEIIQYDETTGNYDRIVAIELALALAMKLDPVIGRIGDEEDPIRKAIFSKNKKDKKPFSIRKGIFRKNKKIF